MSEDAFDARIEAEWGAAVRSAAVPSASAVTARAAAGAVSRAAAVADIEDLRLTLDELRSTLDDTRGARAATRRWSARDVLAHLASWARQTRVEVEHLLGRAPFDEVIHFSPDGPHAWNQREVEARRDWPLARLFEEIDADHERLIALVSAMPEPGLREVVELPRTGGEPPVPWRMPLGAMIAMSCWHARLHLRRLDQILRGRP